MLRVLHFTAWYPHPNDPAEGRYIQDRIEGLNEYCENDVVHLHLKKSKKWFWKDNLHDNRLDQYFLESRFLRWKWIEAIAARWIIREWVKRQSGHYDLIVIHIAYPLFSLGERIRKVIGKPIVLSEHWSAYHFQFNLPEDHSALVRMRQLFNHANGIITVSNALGNDILQFTRNPALTYHCVPNPIDPARFHILPAALRRSFLAVNRWTQIKRPVLLLNAWKIVVSKIPDLRLSIVGAGDLIHAMKSFVNEHKLTGSVSFCGSLSASEVATEMQAARALICSSSYETFSISCAEALMCGTPIISTPLPAIMEYAGQSDALFSTDHSAESLADAIYRFVKMEEDGYFNHGLISERATMRFNAPENSKLYFETLQTFLPHA